MIEFKNFIRGHFPEHRVPDDIKPGKFFRFGKKYVLYGLLFDDLNGGIVGDWRTGEQYVWQSRKSNTPIESEHFANQIEHARALEQAKRAVAQHDIGRKCEKIFDQAPAAPDSHPYLVKKKIKSYGLKIAEDGALMVPVYSVTGDMQSIQKIYENGKKRFFAGGKIAFGCHMIGRISKDHPIVICEGYATGATLHQGEIPFVVVAFNSGNLINVATEVKKQLPGMEIIIAGDDDWHTEGNPGRTAALSAARAVDGRVIFPEFGPDRKPEWTDFNDLECGRSDE